MSCRIVAPALALFAVAMPVSATPYPDHAS
jgi:hypothetical protein